MIIRPLTIIIRRLVTFFISFVCLMSFQMTDYEHHIEQYEGEIILGQISSQCDARRKAEVVFVEYFGERALANRPYRVSFDEENDAWLVRGIMITPFPRILTYWTFVGSVPMMIIRGSDGKVLAVWQG